MGDADVDGDEEEEEEAVEAISREVGSQVCASKSGVVVVVGVEADMIVVSCTDSLFDDAIEMVAMMCPLLSPILQQQHDQQILSDCSARCVYDGAIARGSPISSKLFQTYIFGRSLLLSSRCRRAWLELRAAMGECGG